MVKKTFTALFAHVARRPNFLPKHSGVFLFYVPSLTFLSFTIHHAAWTWLFRCQDTVHDAYHQPRPQSAVKSNIITPGVETRLEGSKQAVIKLHFTL